jgi:S1-C subfamily serine protease
MHVRIVRARDLAAPSGVGLVQIVRNSPAEHASLQVGDVVVALDDTPITTVDELHHFLSRAAIGATVRVAFVRGGQRRTVPVVLAPAPGDAA